MPVDLFTCPPEDITFEVVNSFITTAIAERLQAESLVLEFKRQNDSDNVAKAVAALANTDGGIVLVGVNEQAPHQPCEGLPANRHDAIVNVLRARIPDAMPEIVPVAVPGTERLILVLRVDPDAAVVPVVLDGKVYKRVPGNSVGARRDEILALFHRGGGLNASSFTDYSGSVFDLQIWPTETPDPQSEIRARARFVLPARFGSVGYLGSPVFDAIDSALHSSPIPEQVMSAHAVARERDQPQWLRTRTSALLIDFEAQPSTYGSRWRPRVEGRCRVSLSQRVLQSVVSVRLVPTPQGPSPSLGSIEDLHDTLLAACFTAAHVGKACAETLGARPLRLPAIDSGVWNVFNAGSLHLGLQRTSASDPARARLWTFPTTVPGDLSIPSLDLLVKEWLHVPLFDFGMTDFEPGLAGLQLRSWARAQGSQE